MNRLFRIFAVFASFFFLTPASSLAQNNTDDALAIQFFQDGEYEKSLVLYRKLFNDGKNPNYYDAYFNNLLKLKLYDEADKTVKKLIKASPNTYTYQVDYGRLLREKEGAEKADAYFETLVKNVPKNETAIRDLANTFYRANAYDFAIKTFTGGRKLLGDNTAFAFDLLALYRYQKNKTLLVDEYLNVIETSPEVVAQAQSVLANVFDGNDDYELLKGALLRRLQKDPQNVSYAEMLIWQYLQQKDFDMALRQGIALDKRLKEDGERIYDLTVTFLSNAAWSPASDALQYLVSKGKEGQYYIAARIELTNTRSKMLTSGKFTQQELQQLEQDYITLLDELGRSANTAFAIQQLANLQAFYLDKAADAETLLEGLLKMPGVSPQIVGQTKLDLGSIYILTGEVWEASLIYSQVEKQFPGQPIGQEARFRNARLSYFQGDFTWAKAQLDVLKSATSQLIANDALNLGLLLTENLGSPKDTISLQTYARADMAIFKGKLDEALTALDSISVVNPSNSLQDDILMAKARIYIKQTDFQKAAIQLEAIMTNYKADLWADDAVFMLADLNEKQLNDPEKAKMLFEKIITDYPSSLYVIEARKRFRTLRGDKLGS
jgi:tetratricopeptide (TPR) repeat protein